MTSYNLQLNAQGELQHLLTIEGLPQAIILRILDTALSFLSVGEREIKKVPCYAGKPSSIFSSKHQHGRALLLKLRQSVFPPTSSISTSVHLPRARARPCWTR